MKKYEKPMLTVLSLNGNDRLCGDCADNHASILLANDQQLAETIMGMYAVVDKAPEGPGREDFQGVFADSEVQCTNKDYHIFSYCKFTSGQDNATTVAWS